MNKEKILKYTAFTMLGMFLMSVIFIVIMQLNGLKNVFKSNPISDFIEPLVYCIVDNPYTGENYNITAIYPPFAYILVMPFALICKNDLLAGLRLYPNMYSAEYFHYCITKPSVIISFVLFTIIVLALVMLLAYKITKYKGENLLYLCMIILCFGPFIYMTARGNIIFLTLVFVMLFIYWYKSQNKVLRELSYVCLAAACAMKIYPVILFFFLFKEKRYIGFLKTLIYSIILIFIPFLLVKGGFQNISVIWRNFTSFNGGTRGLDWTNISLDGLAKKTAALLSFLFHGDFSSFESLFSKILRFSLLIITLVIFIMSKKETKMFASFTLAVGTYSLFQGVSYAYTMIYLIISILFYFIEFDSFSKKEKYLYGIPLLLLSLPISYVNKNYFVQSLIFIFLIIICMIYLIKEIRMNKKMKIQNLE